MKKRGCLALLLCISLAGCNSSEEGSDKSQEKNDLQKAELRGKVKSVSTISAPAQEANDGTIKSFEDIVCMEDVEAYDEAGYLTLKKHVYQGEKPEHQTIGQISMMVNSEQKWIRNANNKVTEESKTTDNDGIITTEKTRNEYYPDGNTVKSSVTDENTKYSSGMTGMRGTVKKQYDEKGNITHIKEYKYDFWGKKELLAKETVYTYRHTDDLTTEETVCEKKYDWVHESASCADSTVHTSTIKYDDRGNETERSSADGYKWIKIYDPEGKNLIEEQTYYNGILAARKCTQFDDSDNIIKITSYDGENNIGEVAEWTYNKKGKVLTASYDNTKITYDRSGIATKIENNGGVIEYKDFDKLKNWIKAYKYDPYGRLIAIQKRIIKYYE